jgi:arylsulfatase A-like enzyme
MAINNSTHEQSLNQRPNIILIMADQMRYDCIQAVNPKIKTPNIQRLVDKGILFERTYGPTPVCLPCRSSILTGQFPSTHGATHNECSLPQNYYSSIGKTFQREGYYTHFIGKSHISTCHDVASPESPPHVFNYDHFRKWKGPWYGFEHADISIGHTTEYHASGMHYGAWLEDAGVDIDKYFGHTKYIDYGTWDLPEEFHSSKWIADVSVNAIDTSQKEKQPFFLWINFQDPHCPGYLPEPWASMYSPEDMPHYGFKEGEPDNFKDKPAFYQEIIDSKGGYACKPSDPDLKGPSHASSMKWSKEQFQENAAHYYGMISLMDKYIGVVIDHLESQKLLDNTIIVFTSDHGDYLGDHGMVHKGLVSFEEAMHVPMIISYPNGIPKGHQTKALHSLVDLPPTFLSFIGADIPPQFEGVDQKSVWKDPNLKIRHDVVVEERPYNTPFNLRVLINEDYKLAFYANRDYGELYHMKTDPHQITNLWDDPSYSKIKTEMIFRLLSREMNKHLPAPNDSTKWEHTFAKHRKDFSDHFKVTGKVKLSENGTMAIDIPPTYAGKSVMEVSFDEILEDYYLIPLKIEIADQIFFGNLVLNNESHIQLELFNGEIILLKELLEPFIDQELYIIALLPERNDSKENLKVKYVIKFLKLF